MKSIHFYFCVISAEISLLWRKYDITKFEAWGMWANSAHSDEGSLLDVSQCCTVMERTSY